MGLGGENCLGFQDGSQTLLAGVVVEDRGVCHDALESDFVATNSTSIQLQLGGSLYGATGGKCRAESKQQTTSAAAAFGFCVPSVFSGGSLSVF